MSEIPAKAETTRGPARRYAPYLTGPGLYHDPKGEYVVASDYDSLYLDYRVAIARLETLTRGGMVEVALSNPNVMDYMGHWEGRAEKAEAEVERLRALTHPVQSSSSPPV